MKTTMMKPILIHPNYWRNSQLSLARFYGAITIEGTLYLLDGKNDYLVRSDFAKYVSELGVQTVEKAVKRYADADKAKKVSHRLARIINAYKRPKRRVIKDFDGQVREWEIWP